MKSLTSLGLVGVSSLFLVLGCAVGQPTPSPKEGEPGKTGQPIINGEPDVTHDAVVAVLGTGACTGTIIHKDVANKKGYVLTAAHCVPDPPQVVVRGTNYANGIQYPIIDYKAHEQYDGSVYDFAMVTFTWNNNEPPVIPITTAAQDNMAPGTNVTFVGYGVTESNQNNSTRFFVDGQLAQVQPLTIAYNQSSSGQYPNNGGPCFGDSGGPALLNVPGVGETVAGITSYGDQDCTEFGVSGRTSAVEGWIEDYITNGGGGMSGQTCDQCFQAATSQGGSCSGAVDDCLNDQQCLGFVQCINDCQTQACVDQCGTDYPNGVDGYLAILACVCDTGCTTECADEPFCQGGGNQECGFTSDVPECATCFEASCCAQGAACAADPACSDCLTGNADPSCIETNGLAAQFYQCLVQKCATECDVGTGGTGGTGGAGGNGVGGAGGAGGGGIGGDGAGGDGSGANGGEGGRDDNNTVAICACRTGAGESSGEGGSALALGAMLMGLLSTRRRRKSA